MADSADRISGAGCAGPDGGSADVGSAEGAEDSDPGGGAGCWAEAAKEARRKAKRAERSTNYLCLQFNAGDWTLERMFRPRPTPVETPAFPPIRDETANGWGTERFGQVRWHDSLFQLTRRQSI